MRGRFAPSPTGDLHLGNVRTALLAWLQAREAGGRFILRLEDLDTGRVRGSAADGILRDLEWLGLDWDEGWDIGGPHAPYVQSERTARYEAAAQRLKTYPCTCSRLEVMEASSAPHGAEARYPGICLRGPTHPERRPALRFKVPDWEIRVVDGITGEFAENVQCSIGDFVVRRGDGAWAYQLACVVDDLAMGITDVLRGADLLSSAARQSLLYESLNAPIPRFWHVPLMLDERGERMAKRHHVAHAAGPTSVRHLREAGVTATKVTRDLAQSLGWRVAAPCTPRDLIGLFGVWLEKIQLENAQLREPRAGSRPRGT